MMQKIQGREEPTDRGEHYIYLGALVTSLALVAVGLLRARSAVEPVLGVLPAGGELLFFGIGGLVILYAQRGAHRLFPRSRIGRAVVGSLLAELGVLFGFVVTYVTQVVWPVVVLGIVGMGVLLKMLRSASHEGAATPRG